MEEVYCVAREDLERIMGTPLPEGGFTSPSLDEVLGLQQHFIAREKAEASPEYKQIIPYQLFCVSGKLFVYQRGKGVGEQRLSGRFSIGIGGHINSGDRMEGGLGSEEYYGALERERLEELICPFEMETRFIGWINDDSDAVGQVHLGAVHCCFLHYYEKISIRPHGEDIHHFGWLHPSEMQQNKGRFEKWSILAASLL